MFKLIYLLLTVFLHQRTLLIDSEMSLDELEGILSVDNLQATMSSYPESTTKPEPTATTPKTPKCVCGVPNRNNSWTGQDYIIGGEETEKNEYPWHAGVYEYGESKPKCGGSIISDTTILTAAHCIEHISPENIDVVVGDHDWTITGDGEERLRVCRKMEHPQYHPHPQYHSDYALLFLCSPLTFRKEVKPICLPSQNGATYDSVPATVTGWGLTEHGQRNSRSEQLMEVEIKTMPNYQCEKMYGRKNILDNMICAAAPGKDSCQGDSGGPLITIEPGHTHYVQIGVVSWGRKCADPRHPGVYARVTAMQQWTESNMIGKTCPTP